MAEWRSQQTADVSSFGRHVLQARDVAAASDVALVGESFRRPRVVRQNLATGLFSLKPLLCLALAPFTEELAHIHVTDDTTGSRASLGRAWERHPRLSFMRDSNR